MFRRACHDCFSDKSRPKPSQTLVRYRPENDVHCAPDDAAGARHLEVLRRVHLLMKDAHDAYAGWGDDVVDRVAVHEQHTVAFSDVITVDAQFRMIEQQLNASIQLVKILVGLSGVPLLETVFPKFRSDRFPRARI